MGNRAFFYNPPFQAYPSFRRNKKFVAARIFARSAMEKKDCYLIGYVQRTTGLKGEVVIMLDVDNPDRYRSVDAVFLDINGTLTPFFVRSARLNHNQLALAFDGTDDQPQAKLLVGSTVWLPLGALPQLDDKHFYFHEIPGYEVIDEKYGIVGTAREMLDRSQQGLLSVMNGITEVLIPLPEGAIIKVDRANRKLYLRTPEGLIDLYLKPDDIDPDDWTQEKDGDED